MRMKPYQIALLFLVAAMAVYVVPMLDTPIRPVEAKDSPEQISQMETVCTDMKTYRDTVRHSPDDQKPNRAAGKMSQEISALGRIPKCADLTQGDIETVIAHSFSRAPFPQQEPPDIQSATKSAKLLKN